MKITIITILLFTTFLYLSPRQSITSNQVEAIDEFIPQLMEESAIPGLAVAKVSEGKISFINSYGAADFTTGRKISENTLFNIASISKPIMGLALLQLVEQGKIELDRDINEYLPFRVDNPHLSNEKITLRHLVSHSSGIADYYDTTSYSINRDPTITLEHHLRSLLTSAGEHYNNGEHFLKTMPGSERKYSNLGAALAGYLVEVVSGQSLAQYSKIHVFKPLAMTQTSWLLDDLAFDNIAIPYEVEQCIPYLLVCANTESPELNFIISEYFNPPMTNKSYQPYPHFGNPQYPDGGIRTSIKELSKFLVYLLANKDKYGNQLLADNVYQEMLALQLPEEVSDSQRFFWRDNSMGLIGHMGSDLGVFTALYFDPIRQVGFIILMNRGMDAKSASAMKK